MIKACKQNKESVLQKVRSGKLDSAALNSVYTRLG